MSIEYRVSQIIKIPNNSYLLFQTVLGEENNGSCSVSFIKNKGCLLHTYNRRLCHKFLCSPKERKDGIRVRYIRLDYRIYLFK